MKTYVAIDLKSFYASVECVERGLDPLTTNLVVADAERSEKTICLAVTPTMKAYGISGRPRLFEVIQKRKEVNRERKKRIGSSEFIGSSVQAKDLADNPMLSMDYITAIPRMAHYMDYSAKIYQIYLKYISPQDIHVYSIDEVMMDITPYLKRYGMTAQELTKTMLLDVLATTGITATAGIGSNLYLAKIAMDITAKHILADKDGVRIAELDERKYRTELWGHRPLTDFWRIGRGYAKKLESYGIYTMGDIARCSLGTDTDYYNEDLLYRLFGVNAELLIDHAWGYEPCTIQEIKAYRPKSSSITSGQVLTEPYSTEKARIVVYEMTDMLTLELMEKKMRTNLITLHIGYDRLSLEDPQIKSEYKGEVKTDGYGRKVPKSGHGSKSWSEATSSTQEILEKTMELFDRIAIPKLWIRRLNISFGNLVPQEEQKEESIIQLDLFHDFALETTESVEKKKNSEKEKKMQEAILKIKKKYGKNAILKGINLEEGATAKQRNRQIGGHRA